jgi:hypothetical protein
VIHVRDHLLKSSRTNPCIGGSDSVGIRAEDYQRRIVEVHQGPRRIRGQRMEPPHFTKTLIGALFCGRRADRYGHALSAHVPVSLVKYLRSPGLLVLATACPFQRLRPVIADCDQLARP